MAQTRYKCTTCGSHRFLPERPSNPQRTVNAGCEHCKRIVRHKPVGVA